MSEIVRMKKEHIASVAEIEKECFSLPWSEEMLLSELESDIAYYFVFVEQGKVCGYCGMYETCGTGNITNIAVEKSCRRQGIADRLISALEEKAVFCKMNELTLEVRESNLPAISLYQKHGFVILGKRRDYYKNPVEDALIMTKTFD